jgi:hypothetical protein
MPPLIERVKGMLSCATVCKSSTVSRWTALSGRCYQAAQAELNDPIRFTRNMGFEQRGMRLLLRTTALYSVFLEVVDEDNNLSRNADMFTNGR